MSGGPADAGIAADGFRWYEWDEACLDGTCEMQQDAHGLSAHGTDPVRVLSVTSIRKLCGESYQLVAWQLANLANAACGLTKRPAIGKRGRPLKDKFVYRPDGWSFSTEPEPELPAFVQMMLAAESQDDLDEARAWLMAAADQPRDTAAIRGTIVHEAIELNASLDRIDEDYVAAAVERLSQRDRAKVEKHGGITAEDVDFVRSCVTQYEDMRREVPFVVLAKEPQVWNLTAGYAGSADALIWFLGEWIRVGADENDEDVYEFRPLPGIGPDELRAWQRKADAGLVTQATIEEVGGVVTLADWKTSKGVYTDQVVQAHAYLAAEYVGRAGVRDERLTALLAASSTAAIIHIRPDAWGVHFSNFETHVLLAFLGSVAFARFLAMHKEPTALFTHHVKGAAAVTEVEAES